LTDTSLSFALVSRGRLLDDEILAEMLEHQGVSFELVTPESSRLSPISSPPSAADSLRANPRSFPIALVSHRSVNGLASAIQQTQGKGRHGATSSSKSVIVADEILDFERIGKLLRGERDNRKDNFVLEVNVEERKLVTALAQRMHDLGLPLVLKSQWPGRAKACCVLTHDVDWMSFSPFHKVVLKGLKNKPLRIPGLVYGAAVKGKNFGWNIPDIIELEKKYGYRSTFLLMTRYTEARSLLARSIELMKSNGCEIALHGSESSHLGVEPLKAEMELFRAAVGYYPRGVRNHILKFRPPDTWGYQSELGLEYDATFGYNRYFGFRGGVCFPYHPFTASGRLPIIELPTGFMDWTALNRSRDGSSFGSYLEQARRRVEEFQGLLVVNFHNTYLNGDTFPLILSEYEALLEKVRDEKYWVATAAECAAWWRKRASARPNPRLTEDGEILVDRLGGISVHTFEDGDMGRLRRSDVDDHTAFEEEGINVGARPDGSA
jgi:peptidoglycan/xylan/chitin deacetylase (PgdA/CDA1 family)